MKPRTKKQKIVYELSQGLPELSQEQERWAYDHCFDKIAYRRKNDIACLDCGHIWDRTKGDDKKKTCKCPNCGAKLVIQDTIKVKLHEVSLISQVTTCGEYQLMRFWEVYANHRRGERVKIDTYEYCQLWLSDNGKNEIIARNQNYFGGGWGGEMSIKRKTYAYYYGKEYNPYAYVFLPNPRIRECYKKYRIDMALKEGGFRPLDLFEKIPESNRLESVMKMRQFSILNYGLSNSTSLLHNYWKSICVATRHKYIVTDAGLWFDMLHSLRELGKDIHNPHYICPKDLKAAHDKWVALLSKKREKERLERKIKEAIESEETYKEHIKSFASLVIAGKGIVITPLQSVQEFIDEGKAMHHCVFTNQYYKRTDSLILSAKDKQGKRLETIEFNLESKEVIQSRGVNNIETERHNDIVSLIQKNINKIVKLRKQAV